MSDEYYSGKNELAEIIEKRNRKYHKSVQKNSGNCCKLTLENRSKFKKYSKLNNKLTNLNTIYVYL